MIWLANDTTAVKSQTGLRLTFPPFCVGSISAAPEKRLVIEPTFGVAFREKKDAFKVRFSVNSDVTGRKSR